MAQVYFDFQQHLIFDCSKPKTDIYLHRCFFCFLCFMLFTTFSFSVCSRRCCTCMSAALETPGPSTATFSSNCRKKTFEVHCAFIIPIKASINYITIIKTTTTARRQRQLKILIHVNNIAMDMGLENFFPVRYSGQGPERFCTGKY